MEFETDKFFETQPKDILKPLNNEMNFKEQELLYYQKTRQLEIFDEEKQKQSLIAKRLHEAETMQAQLREELQRGARAEDQS